MPPNSRFSWRDRFASIRHALAGLALVLRTQHNARIHAVAAAAAVALGLLLDINIDHWCWLSVAIGLVWVTEAFNTAVELLCDLTSPQYHPLVKQAKDVAAGGVLLAAVCACIIGLLILGPPLFRMLS